MELPAVQEMGIDLGTANTLVYVRGRGVVLREPTVIAVHRDSRAVLAVGAEAQAMLGRTPGEIVAIRPMRDGVIADFENTLAMLKYYMAKAVPRRALFRPRVWVSVSTGLTAVERRAVTDAALNAGAKEAHTVEEPLAAAIGAGLPIAEPTGSMIVNIGGGTTEIAILSMGSIVTSHSIRTAGNDMDETIIQHLRKSGGLLVGERTAERIKVEVGSATPPPEELRVAVGGRDALTGLPRTRTVTSTEIQDVIAAPLHEILAAIRRALEEVPPELAGDIMDHGLWLAGGGALLRGLDRLVAEYTKMTVHVAEEPLECVIRGLGKIVEGSRRSRRQFGWGAPTWLTRTRPNRSLNGEPPAEPRPPE